MVKGSFARLKFKFRNIFLEISLSAKTLKADRQLVSSFLKTKWLLINLPLFSIDTGWTIVAKLCKVRKKCVPEYHPYFSPPPKKAKT